MRMPLSTPQWHDHPTDQTSPHPRLQIDSTPMDSISGAMDRAAICFWQTKSGDANLEATDKIMEERVLRPFLHTTFYDRRTTLCLTTRKS